MSLKYVQEHLDEAGPSDVTATFADWQVLVERLKDKVAARFELERDPSTEPLEAFDDGGTGSGARGRVRGYTGPEIDWMVHSFMENASQGFCNVHLTIWLGPQVKVPHFGMALGCFPQGWLYLDSVPRSYLVTDTDSFDQLLRAGQRPLGAGPQRPRLPRAVREPQRLRPRRAVADRVLLHGPGRRPDDRAREPSSPRSTSTAGSAWVDEAEEVPADERAALAADDEAIRRNIAERDPANVMGDRYFGAETTQRLVRALWGGDRVLPAPGPLTVVHVGPRGPLGRLDPP